MIEHHGGCHCGKVRYRVMAPAVIPVSRCNCSVCTKSGYLGLIVPRERFHLASGHDSLTEYTFNTGTAKHLFCQVCGIKAFYLPRSHPDGVSVNANCLDAGTVEAMTIAEVDGQHWEQHYPEGRAPGYPE